VSKSGEYSGCNNLPFSLSRTAGWPWHHLLSLNFSGGRICRQGSSYRSRGSLAASESSKWTLALILSPAAVALSFFFANFKECQLKPRGRQHIQQLFLFENKAPVDIQIPIHIEK
jgi:hypothetical protein